jgi:RNA polymerase sigma-70 factor (ECF subfamily)
MVATEDPLDQPPGTSELVRRASAGDRAAWTVLYDRYYAVLRTIARGRIPPGAEPRFDTDDVLQSTFLTAFRQIDTFESHGDHSFRRWLTEILVNKLKDKIKHHRRRSAHEDRGAADEARHDLPGDDPTPSEILVAAERQAEVLAALSGLPREDQQIVCMRFFDGLAWSEIARRLDLGEGVARRRGLDAIERLVRALL